MVHTFVDILCVVMYCVGYHYRACCSSLQCHCIQICFESSDISFRNGDVRKEMPNQGSIVWYPLWSTQEVYGLHFTNYSKVFGSFTQTKLISQLSVDSDVEFVSYGCVLISHCCFGPFWLPESIEIGYIDYLICCIACFQDISKFKRYTDDDPTECYLIEVLFSMLLQLIPIWNKESLLILYRCNLRTWDSLHYLQLIPILNYRRELFQ